MRTNIDMTQVLDLLRDALARAEELHGRDIPQAERGRDRKASIAEINKALIFLSHLCDKSRVMALDEYHLVRGCYDRLELVSQGASA